MDQELIAQAQALLDLCRRKQLKIAAAESCTGGLRRDPHRDPRLVRRARARLRDLQQRSQAGDARRPCGGGRSAWCISPLRPQANAPADLRVPGVRKIVHERAGS